MSRNHYELKDVLGNVVKIACALATEHGGSWHDGDTMKYRDKVSIGSTKDEWRNAALMESGRSVDVVPLTLAMRNGTYHVLPKEYRLVETGGTLADAVVVHGHVAASDYGVINPSDFADWVFTMADKIKALGFRGEVSQLSRLGENGNSLIGDVLLGEVDFGAGDKGDYFAQVATGYDSDPTVLQCTMTRRVCWNTTQAAKEEALRNGRTINITLKNKGENKLSQLDSLIDTSVTTMSQWVKEMEERMKRLKGIKMEANPKTMALLKMTGLQAGVLKPKKDKETGSVPLTDDILRIMVNGGDDARSIASGDYGKIGAQFFASITETRMEANQGVEDVIDTAYALYQTGTRLATRLGDGVNPHAGLMAWTRGIEKAALTL